MKKILQKSVVLLMIFSMLFGMVPVRAEGEVRLDSLVPDSVDVNAVKIAPGNIPDMKAYFTNYLLKDYIEELTSKLNLSNEYVVEFTPKYTAPAQNNGVSGYFNGNFKVVTYNGEYCSHGCVRDQSRDITINYVTTDESKQGISDAIDEMLYNYRSLYENLSDMNLLEKGRKSSEVYREEILNLLPEGLRQYVEVTAYGCGETPLSGGCNIEATTKINDVYYGFNKINYSWDKIMFVPVGTKEEDYGSVLLQRIKKRFPTAEVSVEKTQSIIEMVDNDIESYNSLVANLRYRYTIRPTSMMYKVTFNGSEFEVVVLPSKRAIEVKVDDLIKEDVLTFNSIDPNKATASVYEAYDYVMLLAESLTDNLNTNDYRLDFTALYDSTGNIDKEHILAKLFVIESIDFGNGNYSNQYFVVDSKVINTRYSNEYSQEAVEEVDAAIKKFREHSSYLVRDIDYIKYAIDKAKTKENSYFDEHIYSKDYENLNINDKVYFKYFGRMGSDDPFFGVSGGTYLVSYNNVFYKYLDGGGARVDHVLLVPEGTKKEYYEEIAEYRVKEAFPGKKVSVKKSSQTLRDYILETFWWANDDNVGDAIEDIKDMIKSHNYNCDTTIYEVTVDDVKISVLIDTSKDVEIKKVTNTNTETGVSVKTEELNVPEDVVLQVKIVDRNETQFKQAQEILKNDNIKAYDISLESNTAGKITETKTGKFEVTIPMGKDSVGKHYVAYFIDSTGKIQRHVVKLDKNGNATFTTNHFSRYIISEEQFVAGDLNYNKTVDLSDVLIMLKMYFKSIQPDEYMEYVADMNKSESFDLTDVLMLLKQYFKTH